MAEQRVGVRELKNRLSEYLRQVKNGATITITRHGVPVARLTPPSIGVEERIWGMVVAGQAEWSGKRLAPCKPAARTRRGYSVSQALVEDRR